MSYVNTLERNAQFYYNSEGVADSESSLRSKGDSGEFVEVKCNQARSLIRNMVTLVSSDRLAFECIALSNDESTFASTRVAKSIVQDVVNRKNVDRLQDKAVEISLVYGSSFYVCKWNTALGEPYVKDGKGRTLFSGDVDIQVKSPNKVIFDTSCSDWEEVEWVIVLQRMNKHTIAAQYRKLKDELEDVTSLFDNEEGLESQNNDMVEVVEFYHKPTPAVPAGRLLVFVNEDIVLFDGKNPYNCIPIVPCIPTTIGESLKGYALFSDLLPLQEMLDNEISSISSNHAAFGVQNILMPREADIDIEDLSGMKVIHYSQEGGVPTALNLAQSSPELFKMSEVLKQNMMEISGINSTVRGAPPSGLTSGVALATLSANSIKFASPYIKASQIALEKLMELVIEEFKTFATSERVVSIAGANNSYISLRFSNADIEEISHIKLRTKNAFSDSVSGRVEIANALLQSQLISNPQDYLQILEHGELSAMTDEQITEDDLIQSENEEMRNGSAVQAIFLDDHVAHISKHKMLINNPIIRRQGQVVEIVLAHIQEHFDLLRDTDPAILEMAMTDKVSSQTVAQSQAPQQNSVQPPPPTASQGAAQPTENVAEPLPLETPLNQGVM